jgi:von Willebrand factor type A domain
VSPAIPLADAPAFRRQARRTRVVLSMLAAASVVAAIGFLLISRSSHTQTVVPLPRHANVVVVLDLSASISSDSFSRIGGTLKALSKTGDHVALIVFSDDAYEALPPGTPAADLAPLIRYFELPKQGRSGFLPSFPTNPWAKTFTGGTKISSGMEMALDLVAAQREPATVILVSDLDDDPGDLPTLAAAGAVAKHNRVPIRIVGLDPSPADVSYFKTIFSHNTPIAEAPTVEQASQPGTTPFPWPLIALVLAAAIALAARNSWAPILTWRRSA